ncbi:MAG: sulfotransferase family 2 domain-containing protein [Bacteroidales bacterium]|nr:sulfotransferase family 2 domain-containing protein [Bacteroidales bacterium]
MFVFVHNEKTAGTSFKFILRNSFGISQCDANSIKRNPFTTRDLKFAKKVFPSLKSITGHNIIEPTKHIQGNNLQYMTFLREPVMRCISNFQDNTLRQGNTLSLEEWIANGEKQNVQVKRIAGEDNAEKARQLLKEKYFFVGLTERFEDSMKLLSVLSPHPLNLKYKKQIIASDNTIKDEIVNDPVKMELIRKYNKLDIELYDYVWNELFPESINKHIEEISKVSWPSRYYNSIYVFNYRVSIIFNKFIYKTLLKIPGRRG